MARTPIMRATALALAGLSAAWSLPAEGQPPQQAQGWITHPQLPADASPVVLHLRRVTYLSRKPRSFPVRVTADNRFVLFVNGVRVAAGPATGDVAHWREAALDLAPYLRSGTNVVAAVIWNAVPPLRLPPGATDAQREQAEAARAATSLAPKFQQSIATGFRLIGSGMARSVSTDRPGWRAQRDNGHSFASGFEQVGRWYYVAGSPETIDASHSPADWAGLRETGGNWVNAIAAPEAARPLVRDSLPAQLYRPVEPGRTVRSDAPDAMRFPSSSVVVPPNSKVRLLLQRDALISAYPQLDVSGGTGSTIRITWAEALYDAALKKSDRNLVGDRQVYGVQDTFLPAGGRRTFAPLWWRTWRYAEVLVETKGQPLVLEGMRAFETGYPFQQIGRFTANDPTLARIFDVGWRTARLDAHETYMDTAYWEQLQYTGDTRLQMLISYAVAGDPRLARQAIDAFAASDFDGGLMDGAYPERGSNVIATFSLLWVAMLDDWRMRQPDTTPITRHLARMRQVLDWFDQWQQPSGLLGKNPQWNFIDWIGQPASDRVRFPSYGKTNESCLTSVSWLGALRQGARIEADFGDAAHAAADLARAERVAKAIRARCWVPARGLYADNPDGDLLSQQMNALAVLYDVATPSEASAILDRIVAPGKGIDAPAGMDTSSYYFAWYLAQAFVHAGRSNDYVDLLDTWRNLLKLNFTTWPEERGDTRTDSHAWSAHPTADLLGIVAGIGSGAVGYKRLRVAPAPGRLTSFDATAATPSGPVRVEYQTANGRTIVTVTRPAALPGDFVWEGRTYPLTNARSRFDLPVGSGH